MFVLDTNVVSELRNPARANAGVLAWAQAQSAHQLFVSAITVLELEKGVLLKERKDAAQGAMLRGWLNKQFFPAFADRILAVDMAVARLCAQFHVPDPKSDRDALIAASAVVHGMTVVTRNTADFAGMGASLFDPWSRQ
jgi:predicted nucleic acid-binding protein